MSEIKDNNINTGVNTTNTSAPELERSTLLVKDRKIAEQALLNGRTGQEAIQNLIDKTQLAVDQLQFEKQQSIKEAYDYKTLWTDAQAYNAELRSKVNWHEDQQRVKSMEQRRETSADYAARQQEYEQAQNQNDLKQKFSNHFKTSIKDGKW
jgi:polyribonucleotide nucleotidyltransferase